MKVFTIFSKTHGKFEILLDNKDFELVTSMGKWNITLLRNKPYAQKRLPKNNLVQMARFLMDAKKGEYVDHINHNTLDNRRSNLRICTNSANLRNGDLRINNTSGIKGVRFDRQRQKWVPKIKVNYKDIFLGRFEKLEDAVIARTEAERKYWAI